MGEVGPLTNPTSPFLAIQPGTPDLIFPTICCPTYWSLASVAAKLDTADWVISWGLLQRPFPQVAGKGETTNRPRNPVPVPGIHCIHLCIQAIFSKLAIQQLALSILINLSIEDRQSFGQISKEIVILVQLSFKCDIISEQSAIVKCRKPFLSDLGCAGSSTQCLKSIPAQICLFEVFLQMTFEQNSDQVDRSPPASSEES